MRDIQPLVSVVMPSFNQARFIESAVRSILEQDYEPLELVVMDGGSSDQTLLRLEALLGEFGTRLRWFSERDSGPAHAINKALHLAQGDIIGWLNCDDLYAPGAVARAVRHLLANPDTLMVYGEGEHIDASGVSLGRYPTHPSTFPIQTFHDGCFICQPTVFLRREVFEAVGYLDDSLATAFDFELWLRIFGRFPDRIAYLDRVQAFSRLHGDCITQTLRRTVAIEGLRVLSKHIGAPKHHWALTYLEELFDTYPFGQDIVDLQAHIQEFIADVRPYLDEDTMNALNSEIAGDVRPRVALPGIFPTIYSDGWAPASLTLRCRDISRHCSSVRLKCVHASPRNVPLSLKIVTNWGSQKNEVVDAKGKFDLVIDFPERPSGDRLMICIASENTFTPRAFDAGSMDKRELSFMLEGLQLSQ